MGEHMIECVELALKHYDTEIVKTYASVFEVLDRYWDSIYVLVSEVLGKGWIDSSIANVVREVVIRLKESIDKEGANFWKVKGTTSVVGWLEEGGVIAKVLVNVIGKKILVTVEEEQGGLTWKVALEAGEWLIPEFSFSVVVNSLKG
jgi:hypothetical protein